MGPGTSTTQLSTVTSTSSWSIDGDALPAEDPPTGTAFVAGAVSDCVGRSR